MLVLIRISLVFLSRSSLRWRTKDSATVNIHGSSFSWTTSKENSWFPRNVTGKCIQYAETCCRSFAMNAHTSWFLACLPLSAQRHPFPLEKRQSLWCPSSQCISVHRRRAAYFQRMVVFQILEMDFISLYVIQNISGFEIFRSSASPLLL